MKTKNIHQTIHFKAKPTAVYNTIMNAEKHAEFTQAEALIEDKAGTEFCVWGGYITGKNLELVKGKKIVQAWRAEEEGWDNTHFSTVTFLFEEEEGGTKLEFEQTGIPAHKAKDIEQGWTDYYWNPMKAMLEK